VQLGSGGGPRPDHHVVFDDDIDHHLEHLLDQHDIDYCGTGHDDHGSSAAPDHLRGSRTTDVAAGVAAL
jgi:hypothetical protein